MALRYHRVCSASDVQPGRCRLITVDEEEIALWRLEDGRFRAIRNVCPHQHTARLHEGELNGDRLSCPMHGWTFDLSDGTEIDGRGKARVYPVKVEDDDLSLGMP